MKHGLVIMRVKATEDSLSVMVSMCVNATNRWVDSSALYLQSLDKLLLSIHHHHT